jgi:tetratricopeptide (TPR) repeat protein
VRTALALLLVLALTAGVYLAAGPRGFVFDDDGVIVRNEHLRLGLSRAGLAWAFGEFTLSNWYPLTWISHLGAYRAFGPDPAGHHAVNLALHLANTALLLLALLRLTGAAGPSLFASALFALHPLHVETAAWVTERCGLLSGFFGLLALWAYAGYARRPGPLRAAAVALAFAAGLLSKAALVTLPGVFLVLDVWPLGRLRVGAAGGPDGRRALLRDAGRLAAEKLPLLALAAAVTAVAFLAQLRAGTVSTMRAVPPGTRLANAAVAYAGYLQKAFWPGGLAVYYPPPLRPWPAAQVGLCLLALGAVTALCLLRLRRAPWLAAGWFWYLVALFPVIGLVKTGEQVMADRYTYLPLTGVFVAVAWGVPAAARRLPGARPLLAAAALAAVAAAAALTSAQLRVWRDNATLFAHAAAVTRDNFMAHYQLGWMAAQEGRRADAIGHFQETVRADPSMEAAQYGLGVLLALDGRTAEAEARYRAALAIAPGHAEAHNNLGELLLERGRTAEAAAEIRAALRLAPEDALAHFNLGRILERQGDRAGALASYRESVRLQPGYAPARERAAALGGTIGP